MALPAGVAAAIGANMHTGPTPMSSFSGPGLPTGTITNGPPQTANVAAILGGTGLDGLSASHVGNQTGSHVAFGNPRVQIQNTVLMDMSKMKFEDVGAKELCWIDMETGMPGIDGQNRPYAVASLSRIIWILKQPEADGNYPYHKEDNAQWFYDRFKTPFVQHHEHKNTQDNTVAAQVFTQQGHAFVLDYWQAWRPNPKEVPKDGPNVGDSLFVVVMKTSKVVPLVRELGTAEEKAKSERFYWTIQPFWSPIHAAPPPAMMWNMKANTHHFLVPIGKVHQIYGRGDRVAARKFVRDVDGGGLYHQHALNMRTLEIIM